MILLKSVLFVEYVKTEGDSSLIFVSLRMTSIYSDIYIKNNNKNNNN